MRIFLTGATGFLGSQVLARLEGHELLCLTRNPQGIKARAPVRFLLGDLRKREAWKTEVEQFAPQWCIHLAWEDLPDYSLSRCRANLDASIGLIEMLADVGIKRIVVAGSCWEYGGASGAVKEDQPTSDCGVFAATKRSLQMVLQSFARDRGFEYRWARIFFSYGPNQRDISLISQCHKAFSQGRQPDIHHPRLAQDFIYVDDVVQALVALTQAEIGSGVFNVGTGVPKTVGHVVNRVANHFGESPLFPVLLPEAGYWADVSKITTATGWRAQTLLDDGITQTLRVLDDKL